MKPITTLSVYQKYSPAGSLDLKAESADIARPGYVTSTPFMYKYNGKEFQDELGLNILSYFLLQVHYSDERRFRNQKQGKGSANFDNNPFEKNYFHRSKNQTISNFN